MHTETVNRVEWSSCLASGVRLKSRMVIMLRTRVDGSCKMVST